MRLLLLLIGLVPLMVKGQDSAAWQDFAIGAPALHMSLPGTPEQQAPKLPPGVLKYIKNYSSSFLKDDAKGLVITIMYAEYAMDVVADAKGALEGTNGQWEKTGSKVAVISTKDIKVSGRRAMNQEGKLLKGSEEHDFMDIVVVEGNKLWQLIIMTKSKEASLKSISQKIAGSLTF